MSIGQTLATALALFGIFYLWVGYSSRKAGEQMAEEWADLADSICDYEGKLKDKIISEQVKNLRLSKQTVELKRAIAGVAPWLSASLSDEARKPCSEYEAACAEIFRLDDIGEDLNNPDVGEVL